MTWRSKAACLDADDPHIFFPTDGGVGALQARAAKAICRECRVRQECLEEGLSIEQAYDFGIWGGTSRMERRRLRNRRRSA